MNTLDEIIEAVRNNERPDYDDLIYAICTLVALETFNMMALQKLATTEINNEPRILTGSAEWQYIESYNRRIKAGNKSPKKWVGWNNDPKNPEFRERRRAAIKIMEKVIERQREDEENKRENSSG